MTARNEAYQQLEEELRGMLRRQADEVRPSPPPWSELTRRSRSVVVSLHTGRPVDDDDLEPPLHLRPVAWWRRPSVAAAAAAVVTLVSVWAFSRATSDPAELSAPPAGDVTRVPAPGELGFDPETAPVIWPSDLDDPVMAARHYLAAVGIPATGAGAVSVVEIENDGTVATVHWTDPGGAEGMPWGGTVYLRNLTPRTASGQWVVVGAAADGVRFEDVVYDGQSLSFTVAGNTGDASATDGGGNGGGGAATDDTGAGPLALTILADDRPVSFGGDPLPGSGQGELIHLDEPDDSTTVSVDLLGRPDVVLRVQPLGDRRMSVTEMALVAPDVEVSTPVTPRVEGNGVTPTTADTRQTGTTAPRAPDTTEPVTLPPETTVPPVETTVPTTTEPEPTTTTTETTIPDPTVPSESASQLLADSLDLLP